MGTTWGDHPVRSVPAQLTSLLHRLRDEAPAEARPGTARDGQGRPGTARDGGAARGDVLAKAIESMEMCLARLRKEQVSWKSKAMVDGYGSGTNECTGF